MHRTSKIWKSSSIAVGFIGIALFLFNHAAFANDSLTLESMEAEYTEFEDQISNEFDPFAYIDDPEFVFDGLWKGEGADISDPYADYDLSFYEQIEKYEDFDATAEEPDEIIESGDGIERRLSPDDRLAVVYEAFYALDPAHNGTSTKSINGWTAGDWNFLSNDLNAYAVLKGWYGSNSSTWNLFYSNPGSYGFNGGYGRLGQCKYGANLIVYRSSVKRRVFPTYAAALNDYSSGARRYTKPTTQARKGDILFTNNTSRPHTAIVVAILSGTEGSSVQTVDVIDSNWVGNEMVCRHILNRAGSWGWYTDLDNYFVVDLRDSDW